MSKVDVTLRSDDAAWFEELREEEAEKRRGCVPSKAEFLRHLMREYDTDQGGGRR